MEKMYANSTIFRGASGAKGVTDHAVAYVSALILMGVGCGSGP
jgi:hypothetical protein